MNTGTFIVAATPIGNPEDFTLRVIRLLKECDVLVVETTEALRRVMGAAGIEYNHNNIVYNHIGNEAEHDLEREIAMSKVLEYLDAGNTVLCVSDEGMPGVNDPGQQLMAMAHRNGHKTSVIPGPSIVTTAFVHAIGSDQHYSGYGFTYWQPIDSKDDAIKKAKGSVDSKDAIVTTLVQKDFVERGIFEAILDVLGDRSVSLCLNMTKENETITRTTLSMVKDKISMDERDLYSIVIYPF